MCVCVFSMISFSILKTCLKKMKLSLLSSKSKDYLLIAVSASIRHPFINNFYLDLHKMYLKLKLHCFSVIFEIILFFSNYFLTKIQQKNKQQNLTKIKKI